MLCLSLVWGQSPVTDEAFAFARKAVIGTIVAALSLPASVAFDQMFWRAQRIANAAPHKAGGHSTEAQLIARGAMHFALNLLDARVALVTWKMAIEELKVMQVSAQLRAIRRGNLASRIEAGSSSKEARERHRLVADLMLTSRAPTLLSLEHYGVDDDSRRASAAPVQPLRLEDASKDTEARVHTVAVRQTLRQAADHLGVNTVDLVGWNRGRFPNLDVSSLVAANTKLMYRRSAGYLSDSEAVLLRATGLVQSAWRGSRARRECHRLQAEALQKVRREERRKKLICPISHEIMLDPVIAADGTTYERQQIERWLHDHDTSPLTGLPLAHKELLPNLLAGDLCHDLERDELEAAERDELEAAARAGRRSSAAGTHIVPEARAAPMATASTRGLVSIRVRAGVFSSRPAARVLPFSSSRLSARPTRSRCTPELPLATSPTQPASAASTAADSRFLTLSFASARALTFAFASWIGCARDPAYARSATISSTPEAANKGITKGVGGRMQLFGKHISALVGVGWEHSSRRATLGPAGHIRKVSSQNVHVHVSGAVHMYLVRYT